MNIRSQGVVAALALVLAGTSLAGCGLLKSPAEGLTFRAPDGWTATPGMLGKFQIWISGSSKQVLILAKLPDDAKLEDVLRENTVTSPDPLLHVGTGKILTRRRMALCGNQQSLYVKSIQAKRDRTKVYTEAVISKTPDATYMAVYGYPIDRTPNPQAEAAIYQLCPLPN